MNLRITITAHTEIPNGISVDAAATILQKGYKHMAALTFDSTVPYELRLLAGLVSSAKTTLEVYENAGYCANPQNN